MKETYTSYGSIEGYLVHQDGKLLIESNVYQGLVPCTFPDDLLDKACFCLREKYKVYLFGEITQDMDKNPVKIEVTKIVTQSLRRDEILELIQGE